jgi:translation initiation factor 3 subunit D
LIEKVMKYDQGKYVLLKDPNKPVMRLYAVPEGTFESDEDSESEDEDIGIAVGGQEGIKLTND